jgi:endonuclease YncB( thermonuclease family)
MIDGKVADKSSTGVSSHLDRSWTNIREQVREIIRTEVDRLHPTDDARRALELIIESSVRYRAVDGDLKITVIDKEGHPRVVEKNGRKADATIHDLLDELRATHPVLFKSPPRQADAHPLEEETAEGTMPGKPKVFPRESEKPQRDWLTVSSGETSSASSAAPSPDSRVRFHLRRGKVRLHGWSRKALRTIKKAAAPGDADFPFVPDRMTRSAERARDIVENLRTHTSSHRPVFALGAIALVALLGAGAFFLSGRDSSSSPQISADGPAETGAVSRTVQANAPAAPASGGRTLRGVPDVIDTATLSLEGEVVRLFGVEWAPGGGKPEDLTRYLQGRETVCEPAGGNDTYRCMVGGQDLSRVVLFNGGGKPTAEATPELKAAADKARETKIGVWNQQP